MKNLLGVLDDFLRIIVEAFARGDRRIRDVFKIIASGCIVYLISHNSLFSSKSKRPRSAAHLLNVRISRNGINLDLHITRTQHGNHLHKLLFLSLYNFLPISIFRSNLFDKFLNKFLL